MIFDLFHSISDPRILEDQLGSQSVFSQFIDQVQLSEKLGFDTVWCAESHFSSETQKTSSFATIPHFQGEVGINSDSFQIAHWIFNKTKKINFGTAIHNIVGGSGGPIASADRLNFLSMMNEEIAGWQRTLRLGIASGRFPYQNVPFGILPRDSEEAELWPWIKRYVFLEALEIFLRLIKSESLSSEMTREWVLEANEITNSDLRKKYNQGFRVPKRWNFEKLSLVPKLYPKKYLEIYLGTHDPLAWDWGSQFCEVNLFNLSFTPPEVVERTHRELEKKSNQQGRTWSRDRLPRTVLVFIDPNRKKAYELADSVLSNYIEAMRGTAQVPDKSMLMERALVGDPTEIREQMNPQGTRGLNPQDRLMLWFEFNQTDNQAIKNQMKMFMEEVVAKL